MPKTDNTPILLDTNTLSKIVTDILTLVGAPATKKSACLNKVAARIAGPRRNWGFLTSRRNPIYATGVSPTLDVVDQAAPPYYTEKIWRGCINALAERTSEPVERSVTGGLALAMKYVEIVGSGADRVFETADQVRNDLVHNRADLLEQFVTVDGIARRMDRLVTFGTRDPDQAKLNEEAAHQAKAGELATRIVTFASNIEDAPPALGKTFRKNRSMIEESLLEGPCSPNSWKRAAEMIAYCLERKVSSHDSIVHFIADLIGEDRAKVLVADLPVPA